MAAFAMVQGDDGEIAGSNLSMFGKCAFAYRLRCAAA